LVRGKPVEMIVFVHNEKLYLLIFVKQYGFPPITPAAQGQENKIVRLALAKTRIPHPKICAPVTLLLSSFQTPQWLQPVRKS
jgi:hypothetical protein